MSRELIPQGCAVFLNLRHLPARPDVEQTAALLGHHPDHIPFLVEGRFLKPLGNPPRNGVKMFATCDVLARANDTEWLDKAARYITRKWVEKNAQRKEIKEAKLPNAPPARRAKQPNATHVSFAKRIEGTRTVKANRRLASRGLRDETQ